jgi:hypothetical protein
MTKNLCIIPFEFSYTTVRCIELKLLYIASILSLIIRLLSLIAWLRSNIKHENGEFSTFDRW